MSAYFEGFSSEFVITDRGRFFLRRGGHGGTPLLLIHGFPESHAGWSEVAPALSQDREVICIDLLGYGQSDAPVGEAQHRRYSKHEMALDCLAVLDALGIGTFSVAGHDRGAFVACRLALHVPERVQDLVVMDNLPTFVLWDRIHADPGFIPHWRNMAQPDSERLLTSEWIETLMRDHTAQRNLDCFHAEALAQFRLSWSEPARIHAFAEDYRAGAGPDVEMDRQDFEAGRRIGARTLVLWGREFLGKAQERPVDTWRRTLIPGAVGVEVPAGHFNAEEAPTETVAALQAFLR
jgi:haloacetate dehalogenase